MLSLIAVSALLSACACAGSPAADVMSNPAISAVRLSAHAIQLDAGAEQTLELQGIAPGGGIVSLQAVEWTAPEEVELTGTGGSVRLLGAQGGRGWVIARASGFADSALVDVQPGLLPKNRVLLDLRQPLQQANTIDRAFALFGAIDHTPYRGARNVTGGWSFTTNANGRGLHAFRADWSASPADQGIRVIHYLPSPKPKELYAQWTGRLGKYAADADANGPNDSYAMWPQSNACKRALFVRPDDKNRVDYTWNRADPEGPKVEMGDHNYVRYGDTKSWSPNGSVGGAPFTTVVRVRAASSDGTNDGIFQLWVNGTMMIDRHDVPATAETFDRWSFPETCVLVPQPQSEYFWDILVWSP